MKRVLDFLLAIVALILTWPLILWGLIAVYLHDRQWPVYSPYRAGLKGKPFRMHKMRTMGVGADKSRVDTTSADDPRITPVGQTIRRYKIDELPQIWNILCGEMSFVGPRPQIDREVQLYTDAEKHLLDALPGITDFSSIVFSDLGDIMAGAADPNIAYNQLVRPWKSRLGLFYVDHRTVFADLALIALTAVAIVSRKHALTGVAALLRHMNAPEDLIRVAQRREPLVPTPPPGATEIVTTRAA